MEYRWKFKLDKNFKPSKSFTHLHQLKSVDEKPKAKPMLTLTARKGSTDYLELRYSPGQDQRTLKKVPLDAFRGRWVEVIETVTYEVVGKASYKILITDVENDDTILEYKDNSLSFWQNSASFVRPKWGIYRSLKNKQDLRDEEVLFADFVITEK